MTPGQKWWHKALSLHTERMHHPAMTLLKIMKYLNQYLEYNFWECRIIIPMGTRTNNYWTFNKIIIAIATEIPPPQLYGMLELWLWLWWWWLWCRRYIMLYLIRIFNLSISNRLALNYMALDRDFESPL